MTEGRFVYNDFLIYVAALKNLYAGEGTVAAKRADIAKILGLFQSMLERGGITYANGLTCDDTGLSDATHADLLIQTSISDGAGTSKGIIQSGQKYRAVANIGGTYVTWEGTAYDDNKIRFSATELISTSTGVIPAITYTTLKNNQNVHIYCLPATFAQWIAEDDLARGIAGINLASLVVEAAHVSGYYAAGANAETLLAALYTIVRGTIDVSGNIIADKVIPASLDKTAVSTIRPENLVCGGMETVLPATSAAELAAGSSTPIGWEVYNGAVVTRSNTQVHSGAYSLKIVSTGADQGIQHWIKPANEYSALDIGESCWVYSTLTTVKIGIYDDVSLIQTTTITVPINTWTQITTTKLVGTGATHLSILLLSTGIQTIYVDGFMVNGGNKCLDYIPSNWENLISAGTYEEQRNLMLNADMAIHSPYSGASATRYAPFGWQLGSVLSANMECLSDSSNGLFSGNATLLKLYNGDEIFSDCFAPDTISSTQYFYRDIEIQVWIKAHATPGNDPVILGIRDSGATWDIPCYFIPPASYVDGLFYVRKATVPITTTGIQVYLKNNNGSASFCQFYLGGVLAHVGKAPTAWRPGNNHNIISTGYGNSTSLSAGAYVKHHAVTLTAVTAPPILGKVIGCHWGMSEDVAPITSADKLQLSISDNTGAEALPATGLSEIAATKHTGEGYYTIPNASRPIIEAGGLAGARVGLKISAVGAGGAGSGFVSVMNVYTLK